MHQTSDAATIHNSYTANREDFWQEEVHLFAMANHVGDELGGQPVPGSHRLESHQAPNSTHCLTLQLIGSLCLLHLRQTATQLFIALPPCSAFWVVQQHALA